MAVPEPPLTTEQFVDLLASKSPTERSAIKHLHVIAYPFPLFASADEDFYTTYSFDQLLPIFDGLNLDKFEVEEPYHAPYAAEDGWGHDATYHGLEDLLQASQGWKELVYRSQTDKWLKPVTFTSGSASGTEDHTSGRDPQPESWDKMIKERDGAESGASVEMWVQEKGEGTTWRQVSGGYKPKGIITAEVRDDGYDPNPGMAVEFRARRGEGVDYQQTGEKVIQPHETRRKRLYELFETDGWEKIKETVFLKGAENDPTAHL